MLQGYLDSPTPTPIPFQALGYSVTILGFGAYNYVKLSRGASPGAPASKPSAAGGRGGDALWLRGATAIADVAAPVLAFSSVPINLALYIVSGVFQVSEATTPGTPPSRNRCDPAGPTRTQ